MKIYSYNYKEVPYTDFGESQIGWISPTGKLYIPTWEDDHIAIARTLIGDEIPEKYEGDIYEYAASEGWTRLFGGRDVRWCGTGTDMPGYVIVELGGGPQPENIIKKFLRQTSFIYIQIEGPPRKGIMYDGTVERFLRFGLSGGKSKMAEFL